MTESTKQLILQCLDVLILDAKIELGKAMQNGLKRKDRQHFSRQELLEMIDDYKKRLSVKK